MNPIPSSFWHSALQCALYTRTGQVQDIGLIFLSTMARDMVSKLNAMGANDASILATVTIGLSTSTLVLGCALLLIGKLRLAFHCQLLPSSVVGGYLAYIGFFCGQAGLAFIARADVHGPADWPRPITATGCGSWRRACSGAPTYLVYAALWATGMSVREAAERRWISKGSGSPSW